MPLAKDPGQSGSDQYCSYCFQNGKLTYEGNDLKEFQTKSYQAMIAHGTPKLLAKLYTFMICFAPRWKKNK